MKLKPIAVGMLTLMLLLGVAAPVGATTTSNADIIRQLQAQIADLQVKLAALQKAKTESTQVSTDMRATLKLLAQSGQEMSSDDIALLQTVLAADESIYPEGKITGYHGKLTEKALKRFQKKNGLNDSGRIDDATRDLLNRLLDQQGLMRQYDQHGKRSFCVAVGHIIAPGWKKKNGQRLVSECFKLPPGIWKQIGTTTPPTATTTNSVAPSFLFLNVADVTPNTAAVVFGATKPVRAKVVYAINAADLDTSSSFVERTTYLTAHSIPLTNLATGTTYSLRVIITDAAGNIGTSSVRAFNTSTPGDTSAPTISSIIVSGIASSSATVAWVTNEPSKTKVYYTSGAVLDIATAPSVSGSVYSLVHEIKIPNLVSAMVNRFVIESEDVHGNKGYSTERTILTLADDTVAPSFLSIVGTPTGQTSASVVFVGSEPTTGSVFYGGSTPLDITTALSLFDMTLSSSHTFTLSGLVASTTYQFVVVGRDGVGNSSTSTQQQFTTLP